MQKRIAGMMGFAISVTVSFSYTQNWMYHYNTTKLGCYRVKMINLAGKLFASFYALYSGVAFLATARIQIALLAPGYCSL